MDTKQSKIVKSFASDNYSGIHPEILQAIIDANMGHAKAMNGHKKQKRSLKITLASKAKFILSLMAPALMLLACPRSRVLLMLLSVLKPHISMSMKAARQKNLRNVNFLPYQQLTESLLSKIFNATCNALATSTKCSQML